MDRYLKQCPPRVELTRHLLEPLRRLHRANGLPYRAVCTGETLYRTQRSGFAHAEYFGIPSTSSELGRYGDPRLLQGIWYGAQDPESALAETFGRLRAGAPLSARPTFVAREELQRLSMATVEVTRPLHLLDLPRALSKLRLTADQITSGDYTLTQTLVRIVLAMPGLNCDGIAYCSRHYQNGSFCYALWERPRLVRPVRTLSLVPLAAFTTVRAGADGAMVNVDAETLLSGELGFSLVE